MQKIEIAPIGSNNWIDITDYLAFGGLKWSRNDIDSSDAGRTQDGLMHRGRVGTKIRLDCTCRYLNDAEIATLLTAIMPEFIQVRYKDPQVGATVVKEMYSNNNPATYSINRGTDSVWGGVTFPLIEK